MASVNEKRDFFSFVLLFAAQLCASPQLPAQTPAEAFEIGAHNVDALPLGKEADGIIGDFVLRNAHIEALVGGNLPLRRANMSTDYKAPTPGCLYDLAVRGTKNDQLTKFAPGQQLGSVSSVGVQQAGGEEAAIVMVHRSRARGDGHEVRHLYWLEPDWRYLQVVSVYTNHADTEWELDPSPAVKGLGPVTTHAGVSVADAMNPSDRQAYAWAALELQSSSPVALEKRKLKPGEQASYAIILAPGHSPAEAYSTVLARQNETGQLRADVRHGNEPVASAALRIELADGVWLPAYPHADGSLECSLAPGTYRYETQDLGRPTVKGEFSISAGETTTLAVELEAAARITLDVSGVDADASRPFPCKAQFIGIAGTPNPHFGVDIQARGCRNQYHSEVGEFSVQIPPGDYLVTVTRGIEYSHFTQLAVVKPGETTLVSGRLRRLVQTRGWVSTDFHNHSTPSGDNYCGTDDRVINLAAEHIEFAPTTEHNRLYDWQPHIDALGLSSEMSTVVGLELTGPNAHFNSFPFKVHPWLQDGGAPVWQHDPRLNAIVLRDYQERDPNRYVQINHPNVGAFFRDRDRDGVADGGYVGLENLIDAAEVWSTEIVNPEPRANGRANRTFQWLQLLNQGRYMYCVAVSDAHSVFGNGVGGWRTYVPSSTDDPSQIDYIEIVRHAKSGRTFMTNGPFLEVSTDNGTLPGGHTIANGSIDLDVRVQCTDWIDIDRVQILVNGRQPQELNFRRSTHEEWFTDGVVKFERRITVPLGQDAHIIVAAIGEGFNLKTGYGESWQSQMHPVAFTNPIFVDVSGDGFRANGDNLGHPLPLGK